MRCWRRGPGEGEIERELRDHVERRAAEYRAAGLADAEARRRAAADFGALAAVREACREARGGAWLEALRLDLRFALRWLRRSPVFTAALLVTLALGIGSATALFSVLDGVLLEPLPFPQPKRLVDLYVRRPNFARGSIGYPNFLDWQAQNCTFAAMAAYRGTGMTLSGRGDPEALTVEAVTPGLFPLLGVRPIAGRTMTRAEGEFGAAPVALVSEGLWRRKFGGTPAAIGAAAVLDGRDFTIIGVIPAAFRLRMQNFRDSEVYIPLAQWANPILRKRSAGLAIDAIGRLRPGVSLAQARADMDRVTADLAAAYPLADKDTRATLVPLAAAVAGSSAPYLWLMLAAAILLLLIAVVNVANLLLARAAAREREFALRSALGAGRERLLRQWLAEGLLLGSAGGALGLLLAAWATRALLASLPITLPRADAVGVDVRVALFAAAVSLLSAVFFSLAPGWRSARPGALAAGRGVLPDHRGQRRFAAAQLALATVLIVAAALMGRTLLALARVDPGFDPSHAAALGINLPPGLARQSPTQIRAVLRRRQRELAAIPGIAAAALSWGAIPLSGDDEQLFWLAGRPRPASENDMDWALKYIVGPDYLGVLRIPLRRGRFFTPADDENAPLVAAVDEDFAARYFPGRDPIGQRLVLADGARVVTVVGIVGHVRQWGLDVPPPGALRADLYLPFAQLPANALPAAALGIQAVVRAQTGEVPLATIARVLARSGTGDVLEWSESFPQAIADTLADRRAALFLLLVFASLAVALAGIGIYGVISYWTQARRQEIGVRMALGARPGTVARFVVGQSLTLALWGAGIGVVSALLLTRLMRTMLYGIGAADPPSFALAAALAFALAALAAWLPARRAARLDAIAALRQD